LDDFPFLFQAPDSFASQLMESVSSSTSLRAAVR